MIAEVDGEWTMKYLDKSGDGVTLMPANPKFKPIKPKKELEDRRCCNSRNKEIQVSTWIPSL